MLKSFIPLLRFSVLALVTPGILIGLVQGAGAQNRKLVLRGREVLVAYDPTRGSRDVGAFAVSHLRVPAGLRAKEIVRGKGFAVVTSNGVSALSEAPVEVDEEDIARVCEAIIKANRGLPILCEANNLRYASLTPNDSFFSELYGLKKMRATSAWNISTGSPSVIVAVIDTGVKYDHPDLADNIAINEEEIPANGLDDDGNGYIDDYYGYDFFDVDGDPLDQHGHGTHCAGIIGAKGNNGKGVVGINWNVSILPVRVLGPNGGGTDEDVAWGINYAIERGASVVSLSLGGSSPSTIIDSVIEYARDSNVLVVAAAGNDSANNETDPTYPASSKLANIISVAATDNFDDLAYFSNYGRKSVDVGAPGSGILSTFLDSPYETLSGTSMATPYVAGLAALIRSVRPTLGYADVKSIILNTVDPLSSLENKTVSGGRVNAYRAVKAAQTGTIPTPIPDLGEGKGDTKRTLTIKRRRYGRSLILSGKIRNSHRKEVPRENVYSHCTDMSDIRKRSDRDGFYAFKFSTPRRATRCYITDNYQNRSRSIRVR